MKATLQNNILETPPSFRSVSQGKTGDTQMITGFRKMWVEFQIRLTLLIIATRIYKNPIQIYHVLKELDSLRKSILGPKRIQKLARVGQKFYWDLYMPGFPSRNFNANMAAEMKRIHSFNDRPVNRFVNVFISTTKKCALKCEHCFEWDSLNQRETLSLIDLKSLVKKFQSLGTGQIQLAGAEPMMRVKDVIAILDGTAEKSDFWILTSGFNLNKVHASTLKKAGLVGVVVSLDHYDSVQHNLFRGHENSFSWALEGVKNAQEAGLATALSVCVVREFITESNLSHYMDLAKELGVAFVQILEPRAIGHYAGKDVALTSEQEWLLEDFTQKMNFDPAFGDFPVIVYHGYHQRRVGCFAAGNRNLYIDTDGDIHACPFCQKKSGYALDDDLENHIARLQLAGCHEFNNFSN